MQLQEKGLEPTVLRRRNNKALIYVCWKVYCNECEAVRMFAKFNKCRDGYLRLWKQGRSVLPLTVAA